jgi:LTXXQ motif family protein
MDFWARTKASSGHPDSARIKPARFAISAEPGASWTAFLVYLSRAGCLEIASGIFRRLLEIGKRVLLLRIRSHLLLDVPRTPVARLDAVATRLKAMADAMTSLRPKLENFYASLSDEQKANFNTMGSPQPSHQSSGR